MKAKHLLLIAGLYSLSSFGQFPTGAVPSQDYVTFLPSTFTSIDGTPETFDNMPSAIDITNNAVYITGYSRLLPSGSRNYVLIKYHRSSGAILWTKTFDYAGLNDRITSLAVDNSGNVLVTGEATSVANGTDIVTQKYDTNGNLIWSKVYNGSSNSNDGGLGIATDISGDVYVCGYSSNTGTGKDFTVIKYNNAGVQQYVYTKNGTANGDDQANAIVSFGNKLNVVGNVNNILTANDIYLTRLNSNNAWVNWSKTENGTANAADQGLDIRVQGNDVLVCGGVNNTSTGQDYFFGKYNGSNGNTIFTKTYNAFGGNDFATSLTLDASNTYAIVGVTQNGSNYEYHTTKYNNSGTLSWVNKHKTNTNVLNVRPKIAVDNLPTQNHFYVSGITFNTSIDAALYQITPGGNQSWVEYYDGTAGLRDGFVDLSIDDSAKVYVATLSEKSTPNTFDIVMIRYSQVPVYFPPDLGTPEIKDKNFVFKKNMGQLKYVNNTKVPENEVSYYYQGKSPSVYINNNRISYLLIHSDADTLPADSSFRLDINLNGANNLSKIYSFDMVNSYSNYFIDSESFPNVKGFERLFIPNAYSLVDVHHTSNTSGLKTYFAFKNNEAIYTVTLGIDGSNGTYVNLNGELIAQTDLGPVNIGKLNAYQVNASLAAVPISGTVSWVSLGSNKYGFSVSSYNPVLPLIITLSRQGATSASSVSQIDNIYWSTYFGDVGSDNIAQNTMDARDQLYATGWTFSSNFPTTPGAYQSGVANPSNRQFAFFSKFNPTGNLNYGTYYGSVGFYNPCASTVATEAMDITVDSLYNIYIVGKTNSTTLPIMTPAGAMSYTNNGAGCQNAYIAKFDSSGTQLKWSSYFGGTGYDMFWFVKYGFGSIICGGASQSTSIPLANTFANSYQTNSGRGSFLHLDTSGVLIHSTKLKGEPKRGDFDKNGNAYVVGTVSNLDPTSPVQTSVPGYYQQGWAGGANDWFIHKFNPFDSLTWATNVGGAGIDECRGIYIRDSVMALCGSGTSANFPFQKSPSDSGDVAPFTIPMSSFIADEIQLVKFNLNNGKRLWAVYHASFMREKGYSITLDKDYNLYVTGSVECPGGSTVNCTANLFKLLPASGYYNQSTKIAVDAFMLAYNNKNQKKWLTYFGSSNPLLVSSYHREFGHALSINSKSQLFLSGYIENNNSGLPLSKWNSTCYYDSTSSEPYPSAWPDGFITMFDVSGFNIIGIEENELPVKSNSFILFPNPNSGTFVIKLNEAVKDPVDIEIYNVLGQSIYSEKKIRDKQEIQINLNSLTQGIYFVNISNDGFNETVKFIVQ